MANSQAMKLRTEARKVIGSAKEQVSDIKTDPEWLWARNPENCGKLENAVQGVTSQYTDFTRRFVNQDPTKLKQTKNTDELDMELTGFLGLAVFIEKVSHIDKELNSRHQAILKAAKDATSQKRRKK